MTVKFMVCKAKLRLVVSSAVEGGATLFENLYPGVCSAVIVRLRPPRHRNPSAYLVRPLARFDLQP
jgi:hypothetical protein